MNDLGQTPAPGADSEAERRRKIQLGAIGFFIAAAIIAALIAISQGGGDDDDKGDSASGGAASVAEEFDGIPQAGTILGEESATVTVIEFGDLQCPICKDFSDQDAPELVELARNGEIKYEFKQWPFLGPDSNKAAAAAMAAGEQGKYWQFVTNFYANQGPENEGYVTPEYLDGIAEGAGIEDLEKWRADSDIARWKPVFDANDKEATGIGFTGTPSFSVVGPGGRKDFTGNTVTTVSDIKSAIDSVQ
jgi:protein-disulfide isomerase